jgi:hypothetical protein
LQPATAIWTFPVIVLKLGETHRIFIFPGRGSFIVDLNRLIPVPCYFTGENAKAGMENEITKIATMIASQNSNCNMRSFFFDKYHSWESFIYLWEVAGFKTFDKDN